MAQCLFSFGLARANGLVSPGGMIEIRCVSDQPSLRNSRPLLRLLPQRLSNREIAGRLHLSPRTVEKHVASLITKTGQPDRIALGEFAATALPPG